ncbi:MAG: hypothetical protein S0880_20080 [Actinomycetota bacterium]|nr:hypothetical protein [Actinomycetota bacterium]
MTGLDPSIRDGMAQLVLAALGTSAPGYHAEITTVSGQYVAAFRPHGSEHQVIDVTDGRDVTATFRTADGWLDLMVAEPGPGLDGDERVRWLWLGDPDLDVGDPAEAWLRSLWGRDGDAVVRAATAAIGAERRLKDAVVEAAANTSPAATPGAQPAPGAGSDAWTAAVSDAITAPAEPSPDGATGAEAPADAVEQARARHDRMRRITLWTGLGLPVAALASLVIIGPVVALALIVLAILVAGGCLLAENKLRHAIEEAKDAERRTPAPPVELPSANGQAPTPPSSANGAHPHLRAEADSAQQALASWTDVAGDVPPSWVSEHAAEVRVAAAAAPDGTETASARAVTRRLLGLDRRLSALRERLDPNASLPLLVSDPLDGLDDRARSALGHYLVEISQRQQIVVLSDDPATAEWAASMAQATGAVGLVDLSQPVPA